MLSWRKGSNDNPDEGPSLEQVLIEEGLVTEDQIEAALAEAEEKGIFFGHLLVRDDVLQEREFIACLVKNRKIPYLSLIDYDINESLVDLVSEETCRKFFLLPVDKMGKILTVAMVNPLDNVALTTVREACPELRIKPILCDWNHYVEVAARHFAKDKNSGANSASSVSMESLGLGSARPGASAPKKKAEPEAPKPAAETTPQAPQKPATPMPDFSLPSDSTTIDPALLADAIRSGMNDAMASLSVEIRALVSQLASNPVAVETPTMDTSGLEQATAALTEAASLLASTPRAPEADQPVAAAPHDSGLGQATEALLQVANRLSAAFDSGAIGSAPAPIAPPDLSGLNEATAALSEAATRLSAAADVPAQAPAPAPVVTPDTSGLDQATAALTEAANRLIAAADATTQAVEAKNAEQAAAIAATEGEANNEREQAYIEMMEQRARFNSVQAFPTEGDTTGGDDSVMSMLAAELPLTRYTFNSYCVSASNEFTAKVCRTIAENPGQNYNPCFVHGQVGSGKTHLLSAVGNAIRAARPDARVGYASADRFAERLTAAKRENAIEFFREAYAQWDVLILDDAQFLAGNAEAQEEFFHVFNALLNAGRQVLIAADKSPKQLGHLENRLISRFESGILTKVEPPDHVTRVAILKNYSTQLNASVPDDVLTVIASRVRGDVRMLIGALRKVIAFAETVGQDITSDIADQVLEQLDASDSAA